MGRILELHCLDPTEASRLVDFGIASTDRLLLIGAHKQGREDIAAETEIAEELLLRLVHLADLMRVNGIGTEYCGLLDEAGVHTLKQLARRSPERLFDDLQELNQDGRVVRRLPSRSDIKSWIDHATELESIITY